MREASEPVKELIRQGLNKAYRHVLKLIQMNKNIFVYFLIKLIEIKDLGALKH
jgi:hypothetical protein